MPVTVTNPYVTQAEIKATLSIAATETYADDDIARAVNAASRLIDEFCGQRFWRDAADATRVITATSTTRIDLRALPLASITSLKSDQNGDGAYEYTWAATDYYLRPLNAAADGLPYTYILRNPSSVNTFPTGEGAFQIVGQFGWPAVPAVVVEACRMQTVRFIKRTREAPLGVAGLAFDGGAVRIMAKLDPDVEVLLGGVDNRQRIH